MNARDRITVSIEEIVPRLEQGLDRLSNFRYDSKYRSLLGQTMLEHMETWDRDIRQRKNDPFTVVVAGEFKRGKSTFINALLGEKIVPTDVLPETMTLNRLHYGPARNEAVLSGGRRIKLSDEELTRSALEKLIADLGEPIRQLELWRPNEGLKDICIIDTPGLNEVSTDFEPLVAEAIAQADAVVYIYAADAPLSHSEQMYLKYSVLPQGYTRLFMLGNHGDMFVDEKELQHIRRELEKRVAQLLPEEPVYIISALDEMCRLMGERRPNEDTAPILEKDFALFRADLAQLVEAKKSVIAADRMMRQARLMRRELNDDLDNLEKGMAMDAQQLAAEREKLAAEKTAEVERLSAAQKKAEEQAARMVQQTASWMAELINKLQKEDLTGYSVQDLYQYYSYYCIDTIETAARACLEQHRDEMLEQMSAISDELGRDLAGAYTKGDAFAFRMALDSNTWTRGDSVTLVITQLSGNALVNAVTDLVGSLVRKNELENNKEEVLKSIQDKFPVLRAQVDTYIEKQYRDLAQRAKDILAEYYQRLIDRAQTVVEQYEQAGRKDARDKEQTAAAVAEVRDCLESLAFTETGA